MNPTGNKALSFLGKIIIFSLLSLQALSLNSDGTLLLSLRYSILADPSSALDSWHYDDLTPCSWFGVTCTQDSFRVISLVLHNTSLTGSIPPDLGNIQHLQYLDLSSNFFNGTLPSSLSNASELRVLDLSSNLFNGPLPSGYGGGFGLQYLNLSHNNFSGELPPDFGSLMPENSTIDLSFNNLTGQIPASKAMINQKPEAFTGNLGLCGKPSGTNCVIPSSLSTAPNTSTSTSISPAIAVIPKTISSDPRNSSLTGTGTGTHGGLKPTTIVGITVADLAGIAILGLVLLYLYQLKRKKHELFLTKAQNKENPSPSPSPSPSPCCCLNVGGCEGGSSSDSRASSSSSEGEEDGKRLGRGGGSLVMVDGETEMEMETLLKASAYILGASGSSIVYKAVLQNGDTFAVRRLGDSGAGRRMKEFESQVRGIAKLQHRNLVRVRGFYWGDDEKLVIYDYVSNGSLASTAYKKLGSSPFHLPLEIRLKIARGVARGLAYIHEKKFVHGSLKPSNILLTAEMEPLVSDLGLTWLIHGNSSSKGGGGGSGRQFGSKRSMGSHDTAQELPVSNSPHINPCGTIGPPASPYKAPESLKNLKPSPKWDVYSFGIVLLELLTGKVYLDRELAQWTPGGGLEDRYWVLRMADVAIRAEVQGREEDVMGIFRLGFSCANLMPQKRPAMKDALQILERSPLG